MQIRIAELEVGQKFRTLSGSTVYTIKYIVKTKAGKPIWLLNNNYYVEDKNKLVILIEE